MEPRTFETTLERRRADNDTLTLERPVLSIEQEMDSFNPYDRRPVERCGGKRPAKTDLRKLSEWIKAIRTAEEAKKSR